MRERERDTHTHRGECVTERDTEGSVCGRDRRECVREGGVCERDTEGSERDTHRGECVSERDRGECVRGRVCVCE